MLPLLDNMKELSQQKTEKRDELYEKSMLKRSTVSYTHLRAHETEADLVCRLLLEKKN